MAMEQIPTKPGSGNEDERPGEPQRRFKHPFTFEKEALNADDFWWEAKQRFTEEDYPLILRAWSEKDDGGRVLLSENVGATYVPYDADEATTPALVTDFFNRLAKYISRRKGSGHITVVPSGEDGDNLEPDNPMNEVLKEDAEDAEDAGDVESADPTQGPR